MAEVFLPKDQLLSSAGILPVYYWLVRNRKARELPRLREFLVRFEEERKANRELTNKVRKPKGVDKELSDFDAYNRSTNDERSHAERYSILMARFTEFLQEN